MFGQKYSLICAPEVGDGVSITNITWYINETYQLDSTTTNDSLTYTISSLKIEDRGNYTCEVAVDPLKKNHSVALQVKSCRQIMDYIQSKFNVRSTIDNVIM